MICSPSHGNYKVSHVNNHSLEDIEDLVQNRRIDLEALEAPLDWSELFGRPGPNAVEIGTGNGYFLEREAARRPEFNFIGIELETKFYYKMAKRCARAGLGNVRTLRADAREVLREWIAPGTMHRLYSYFSDPWPKRRHRGRRLFNPELPEMLERVLAPEGQVWFKTDVGYYFNLAVSAFRQRGGWRFEEIGRLAPPDPDRGEVMTNYERKAREAGREVWGFKAQRDPK